MMTHNFVPRANDDGETLGTPQKQWSNVYTKDVSINGNSLSAILANKTDTVTLATVATSGNYNDLNGKPTNVSAFNNDVGYLTEHQNINGKLNIAQGSANAGKVMTVGDDGNIIPMDAPSGIDVGMIIPFAGNGDVPVGFLVCNGASVSKITYPALFDVIGYTYGGSGDYFKLPDLIDKFIEGGNLGGVYKEAGLPNITGRTHHAGDANHYDNAEGALGVIEQGSRGVCSATSTKYNVYKNIQFDASRSNSVYGNSETVQPPALTVRYIIKAFAGASADSTDVAITNVANDLNTLAASVAANDVVEQGEGYIRYANGLQLCWGYFDIAIGSGAAGASYEGPPFPLPFIVKPMIMVTPSGSYGEFLNLHTQQSDSTKIAGYYKMNSSSHNATSGVDYLAIGGWK